MIHPDARSLLNPFVPSRDAGWIPYPSIVPVLRFGAANPTSLSRATLAPRVEDPIFSLRRDLNAGMGALVLRGPKTESIPKTWRITDQRYLTLLAVQKQTVLT